jgi:hypothetical protein
MNERVYLQYEYSQLGIDHYLDKLKNTPSEELRVSTSTGLDGLILYVFFCLLVGK